MFASGWALKRLYKFVLKRLLGKVLKNELDLAQVRHRPFLTRTWEMYLTESLRSGGEMDTVVRGLSSVCLPAPHGRAHPAGRRVGVVTEEVGWRLLRPGLPALRPPGVDTHQLLVLV
jgi:hypothetical protein